MPTVTLSTYTYNDAPLVRGLLESVREWTLQPAEIIVTDDGSRVPFTLEREPAPPFPPVRIRRLPHNRGFASAKQAGISAASGDIVLSADCDARLHPDYLRVCLEHLADKSVGMVSGSCLVNAGEGSLGLYLRLFGDNYLARKTGEVDFIPGVAFAMRKEVWNEVNGFAGHGRATCEDHVLCGKLRKKGYRLIMAHTVRAVQTRRLSRQAQCRRLWLWCGPALLAGADEAAALADQFLIWYVIPLIARIRICIERDCPGCIYHDLLHVTHAAFAVCRELGQSGRIPLDSARSLLAVLEQRLSAHPLLWSVLKKDWLALGVLPPPEDMPPVKIAPPPPETAPLPPEGPLPPVAAALPPPEDTPSAEETARRDADRPCAEARVPCGKGPARSGAGRPAPAKDSRLWQSAGDWAPAFAFLDLLASSGVLSRLNDREVPLLLAEDQRLPADFSSYYPEGVTGRP